MRRGDVVRAVDKNVQLQRQLCPSSSALNNTNSPAVTLLTFSHTHAGAQRGQYN